MRIVVSIFFLATVLYADIFVISSQECKIERLTKKDIRELFLLKKDSMQGKKIKILNIKKTDIHREFLDKFLGKSLVQMRVYWARLLFTGMKKPPKFVSVDQLKDFIDTDTCYLSYIDEKDSLPSGWKVIQVESK